MDSIGEISEFHCPRFNELPHVPLYKEQVIMYIEDVLRTININSEDKFLTPTMLNNYVKQKVVKPPKDKKYNEKHLAYLIVVCILKQVYTLTEICELIEIQIGTCPIEQAYDRFCTELEISLKIVFNPENIQLYRGGINITKQGKLIRAGAMAFAHKIFIQKYLKEMNFKI